MREEGKSSQECGVVWCGVVFGRVLVPRTIRGVFVSAASAVNRALPVSWRHFGPTTEARAKGQKKKKKPVSFARLQTQNRAGLRYRCIEIRDAEPGFGI